MAELSDVEIEEPEDNKNPKHTRVALAVALLASFVALAQIKAANVEEDMLQAQAERNNSWAWYQAVRVREDMATYEYANLQRRLRDAEAAATQRPAEPALISQDITAQQAEITRVRARLEETKTRAEAAEKDYTFFKQLADHYDLADALIAIAITLLAVSTLTNVGWLFWFALVPGVLGVGVGAVAMARILLPLQDVFRLLG